MYIKDSIVVTARAYYDGSEYFIVILISCTI